MKTCGKCGSQKPLEQFHRRGNGYQAWCKSCRKSYDAGYHRSIRERRIEQASERREKFFDWYLSLKAGRPCADCGAVFHPAAMQFDHRPGTDKLANVANLARQNCRLRLLAEIEKCDLVCANCHAVRTFSRGRGVAQPG